MTGYVHPAYARSLSEFGEPLLLPKSGGFLLKRTVTGTSVDAMGPYPLFACSDWTKLKSDLENLGEPLVSAVVVTDPFGNYTETLLKDCFNDRVIPFKSHFVTDLTCSLESSISEHHARNARAGAREVEIDRCEEPSSCLDDWSSLYSILIKRHQIRGIRAFSRQCFEQQLLIPGIVCFRASRGQRTVGMTLWYVQGEIAYYHLGAYSDDSYRLRASFAIFREALRYFASNRLRYANLGAGAGVDGQGEDGLSRFKQGWSTLTRTAYLCGRICNRRAYDELVAAAGAATTGYFPAYRNGEFN
jgi:hypothetical protein